MDFGSLKQKLKGELLEKKEDITPYSTDASIFSIMPQAVARPADSSDISTLVNFARENKKARPELSLTVRAGGTDMTGGSINSSIIIDVAAHMNTIEKIGEDYAVAQPGVYYRDFEISTLARNLFMPAYPASKAICALGGMVGNNAGGEKSMSYGQVKDFVEGLWVVLGDGKEYYFEPLDEAGLQAKLELKNFEGDTYRAIHKLIADNYDAIKLAKPSTSKNSSGYHLWDVWDKNTGKFNLTQLFTGSQGTLGIITKIKFRLVKPRRSSGLAIVQLPNLDEMGHIVNTVKKYGPESFELFDHSTLNLAMTYLPEIFRKMKGSRLKLIWDLLPDIINKFLGRLPQIILFAEFTGDSPAEVEAKLEQVRKELADKHSVRAKVSLDFEIGQKYWTIRRETYNLLRMHNIGKISASFIEDIIVQPDQLPEFMPRLYEIFAQYPSFAYAISGHAGDANFHIFPLIDFKDPDQRNVILELANKVFDLVKEFNGSMSAEHNDGIVRGSFLSKMYSPEICELFRQTKAIFDPDHIFNPNKKIEATAEFFTENLKAG